MSGFPSSSRFVRRGLAVLTVSLLLASVVAGGTVTAPGGSQSSAEPIAEGETVESTLPGGDDAVHWYRLDVSAGDAVVAELYALNTSNRTVEVQLYDASGDRVNEHRADGTRLNEAGEVDDGTRERAVAPNVAEYTGTYYVKISKGSGPDASRENEVPYNLTVRTHEMDRYDPNENGSTATPMAVGQDVEAVTAIYDQDVYAVDLVAGVEYTITVTHTDSGDDDTRFSKALFVGTEEATVTDDEAGEPDEANYSTRSPRFSSDESFTFTTRADGVHYVVLGQSELGSALLEEDDYVLSIERTDAGGTGGPTATPTATSTSSPTATDEPVNPTVTPGASPNETPTDTATATPTETVPTSATTQSPSDVSVTVTGSVYPSRSPTDAGRHAQGTTSGGGPGVVGLAAIGVAVLAVVSALGVVAYTTYRDDDGPERL